MDQCSSTRSLYYNAGEVTVHTNVTVQSARANLTDDPRCTYLAIVNPADACWNGAPGDAFQCKVWPCTRNCRMIVSPSSTI